MMLDEVRNHGQILILKEKPDSPKERKRGQRKPPKSLCLFYDWKVMQPFNYNVKASPFEAVTLLCLIAIFLVFYLQYRNYLRTVPATPSTHRITPVPLTHHNPLAKGF